MKKLRTFLILLLVMAMLAACGQSQVDEDPTEEPTEVVTDAPTEEPTEEPTEAPTEPLEPVVGYYFDEPDGFTTMAATESLAILAGPDGDGSSITVVVMPQALEMDEINEENAEESLGIAGDDFALNSMEKTEVDGYPALVLDYTMTASGVTARYTAYFVAANEYTYSFMFADASADGKWADAFAASVATLNMLQEGEIIPVSTDGLQEYALDCGLTFYSVPSLFSETVEGYAACLWNDGITILILEENKAENSLTYLTLENYANLYETYGIVTGFAVDPYGNLATSFVEQGGDGNEYFYYVTVKETEESFWLIQTCCLSSEATLYADAFAQWNATITAAE